MMTAKAGRCSAVAAENIALLKGALADRRTAWSMGSFGALAEFHTDAGETFAIERPDELRLATALGAISFDASMAGELAPIAYETPASHPKRWANGIALCLDPQSAARARRRTLTELGSDGDAVCPRHRSDILFDLGLGLPQADFCIRTGDPELIDILCASEGLSIFDPANPAVEEILHRHPHRVVITNLGRIEVFQKIGGPETGGVSPTGPHTHLLPKLLRAGRTHAATIPIPAGLIPCASIHPPRPFPDDATFDEMAERAFQTTLHSFGVANLVAAKQRLKEKIEIGCTPARSLLPVGRHGRAMSRVLLRQLRRSCESRNDRDGLARLAGWEALVDGRSRERDQPDEAE